MFNATSTKDCHGSKIVPIRGRVILNLCDVISDVDVYSIVCDHMAEYGEFSTPLTRLFGTVVSALEAYNTKEEEQKPIPTRAQFNNAMIALGEKLKVNPNKVWILRF